jgi:predicted translation initiation factor SUI1
MKLKSFSELRQILPDPPESRPVPVPDGHNGKGRPVRITLETKGRKGKSVTIVSGLQHNPATMKQIASELKEHCGTGGTVKNGVIELQGDQRSVAGAKLREMNYSVKG